MSDESKIPKPITAKDTAKVVTPNANALPQLIDEPGHAHFIAAMRESEAAVRNGQVQDIDPAFSEIRGALGL